MNLAVWAEHTAVTRVSADRWFRVGLLPVSAARVLSVDQKAVLDRQVARVNAWAATEQVPVDMVGHRDRFCRFGSQYVLAARAAQGRELVVVDSAEVDEGLVADKTEILTSMCSRLYGEHPAKRAIAAVAVDDREAA